jgi:hypothetical protein
MTRFQTANVAEPTVPACDLREEATRDKDLLFPEIVKVNGKTM